MKNKVHALLIFGLLLSVSARAQVFQPACHNDVALLLVPTAKPLIVNLIGVKTTPLVVNQMATQPVLLEATVSGTPSSVQLEVAATSSVLPLNDAGTNGDKKAGDGVYSALIPAPVSGGWPAFLGYTQVFENGQKITQLNTFLLVRTPDMAAVPVRSINATTQVSDYIYNVLVPSTANSDFLFTPYTKDFYKYHADDFDFINFVFAPGYVGNRTHGILTNAVQGLGLSIQNKSADFGSKGRLLGLNNFPVPGFFDPANTGYSHEIGHQWINHQNGVGFLASGVPHWPFSNLAAGVMGFSIGGPDKAGGSFPRRFDETATSYNVVQDQSLQGPFFNQWEQYLMGLLTPAEVSQSAIVFVDQTKFPDQTTYPKSAFTTHSLANLIAAAGPRVPAAPQSQKQFGVATMVFSETLLTADAMAYFNFMAKRAEATTELATREGLSTYLGKPFQVATQGRATLRALLNTNINCATSPAKPAISYATGDQLCAGVAKTLTATAGAATYIWYRNGVPLPNALTASYATTATGGYRVSVRDAGGCNSPQSDEVVLTTAVSPAKPTIQQSATALASSSASGNQWVLNGNLLAGQTGQTLANPAPGAYRVRVTNASGCVAESDAVTVVAATPLVLTTDPGDCPATLQLEVAPNPAESATLLRIGLPRPARLVVRLTGANGVLVRVLAAGSYAAGWHTIVLDVGKLSAGVYIGQLEAETETVSVKIVVQH
jgi:hypothetical protein